MFPRGWPAGGPGRAAASRAQVVSRLAKSRLAPSPAVKTKPFPRAGRAAGAVSAPSPCGSWRGSGRAPCFGWRCSTAEGRTPQGASPRPARSVPPEAAPAPGAGARSPPGHRVRGRARPPQRAARCALSPCAGGLGCARGTSRASDTHLCVASCRPGRGGLQSGPRRTALCAPAALGAGSPASPGNPASSCDPYSPSVRNTHCKQTFRIIVPDS